MTQAMMLELKEQILSELRADFIIVPREPVAEGDRQKVMLETLIKYVANHCGLTIEAILSHSREADIVRARMIICFIGRTVEGIKISISKIGLRLSHHHATVVYNVKTLKREMEVNPRLRFDVHEIRRHFVETYSSQFNIYLPNA
jgi:chromosomal replication initiation ATPase DnaA